MSNEYIELVGDISKLSLPQQANNGKYYYIFDVIRESGISVPCIAFSGAFDYIDENCSEGDTCIFSGNMFNFKGNSVLNVHRIRPVF